MTVDQVVLLCIHQQSYFGDLKCHQILDQSAPGSTNGSARPRRLIRSRASLRKSVIYAVISGPWRGKRAGGLLKLGDNFKPPWGGLLRYPVPTRTPSRVDQREKKTVAYFTFYAIFYHQSKWWSAPNPSDWAVGFYGFQQPDGICGQVLFSSKGERVSYEFGTGIFLDCWAAAARTKLRSWDELVSFWCTQIELGF